MKLLAASRWRRGCAGHGDHRRVETRKYAVISDFNDLPSACSPARHLTYQVQLDAITLGCSCNIIDPNFDILYSLNGV